MKIIPIDDIEWRRALVGHFSKKDTFRAHEIHVTDLINCIMTSYKRKIFPEDAVDGEALDARYKKMLFWVRGLGFDQVLTETFTEGKNHFQVNDVQGAVDTIFQGVPYELTSSNFLPKIVKDIWEDGQPVSDLGGKYEYKLEQLRLYMAGIGTRTGRLKIIELIGKEPKEFTFAVAMTPKELAYKRRDLLIRRDILWNTLRYGSWSSIPKDFRPIYHDAFCMNRESECEDWAWAKMHPGSMDKAWKVWLRDEYDGQKVPYMKNLVMKKEPQGEHR